MKGTGRLTASIVMVVVLVLGAIAGFATGTRPLLGLDLTGGVSVVLAAPANTDKAVMQKALDRIRDRVDAVGVAEPDISLIGNNLVQVQLPGLGGQGKVVKRGEQYCAVSSSGKGLGCFPRQADAEAKAKAESVQRVLEIIGTTARLEEREVLQTVNPSDSSYKTQVFTTSVIKPDDPFRKNAAFHEAPSQGGGLVSYEDTNGDGFFTSGVDPIYNMGPVEITGADFTKATAQYVPAGTSQTTTPGWRVVFTLNKAGSKKFGDATTKLIGKQLAIILDGTVQSAPTVQSAITGGEVQISGGYTRDIAEALAKKITG